MLIYRFPVMASCWAAGHTIGLPKKLRYTLCNPAKGNEKGNVENKVGYSRRNALVPVPTITDFAAFNEGLWEWCRKDAERTHYKHQVPIRELWEQERGELLKLPQNPYRVFRYDTLVVNKVRFVP